MVKANVRKSRMEAYEIAASDWANTTTMHPIGFISALILGLAMLTLPKQSALVPMVILACFIPSAQRVIVMGADFNLLRILTLFGWARLLLRNEFRGYVWNRLDTLVLMWMASGTICYTLQYGTSSALFNRFGWMFDGLGMYFLFRCILFDLDDLERVALVFIIVSIPVAAAFAIEWSTARNVFSVFGGVPEITVLREGRLRCTGAFSHPILAGSFWASVMPLMMAAFARKHHLRAVSGLAAAFFIVLASASSGPILSVIAALIGMAFWSMRNQMFFVRWGVFSILPLLHFVMNKPVWHLISRVGVIGGSTGWHRYFIFDTTINNFSKWWLIGEPNPLSWGIWQMRDITNQYIMEALRGGLLTLLLFIAIITVGFGMVGKAGKKLEDNPARQMLAWCMGVVLFVHVVTFFGVSYWGQSIMLWYLCLAMIGSLQRASESATSTVDGQSSSLEVVQGPQ